MLLRQATLVLLGCVVVCQAFIGSGDEAYMKKYAIRKVWESCFGTEVVKQIRLEKRAAIAKCRVQAPNPGQTKLTGQLTPAELALVLASQQGAVDKVGQALTHDGGPEPRPETMSRPSLVKDHFPAKKRPATNSLNGVGVGVGVGAMMSPSQTSFEAAKLQALFNYKAQQNAYQQSQAYQPSVQQYNPFMNQYQPNNNQFHQQQSQFQQFPTSSIGYPGGFSGANFQQQFPAMFPQQTNSFYGQPQQTQAGYPFYSQQTQAPVYQPSSFYGRHRPARELTLQSQLDLEALHRAIGAKAENVSCQLQELGYLDDNLEPAYEKISLRLTRLPVEEELKRDMLDGLEFCKRFSQCMPDMRKDAAKFSQDQDKQMFFFSCYKHKKLEACLMKDVRERFLTDDPLTQEDLAGEDLRSLPRGRKAKMPDFNKPKMNPDKFDDLFVHDDEVYFV